MTGLNRSSSEWEREVKAGLDACDKSIEILLIQTELQGLCEKDEIKNAVFITFKKYVNSGKIRIQQGNNAIQFFRVESQTEQPIHRLRAYLKTCLINQIYHILRCNLRERRAREVYIENHEDSASRKFQDGSSYKENPERYIIKRELQEKLNQLRPLERRILELFYFEGLSFREIAERLEAEDSTSYQQANLRQIKGRALERLRLKY